MSISEDKILFLVFLLVAMVDLKQQRNRVYACLETIKTNQLKAHYQNSSVVRFLEAGWLYFNHDVFSCAMALFIIFLYKTKINLIYVVYIILYALSMFMLAGEGIYRGWDRWEGWWLWGWGQTFSTLWLYT